MVPRRIFFTFSDLQVIFHSQNVKNVDNSDAAHADRSSSARCLEQALTYYACVDHDNTASSTS